MSDNVEEYPATQDDIQRNIANGFEDLTFQKRSFVRKYLETYDARKAAREVSLPVGKAHLVLREPLVDAFLAHLESHYVERSFLSKEMVLMEQLDTLEKLQGRQDIPMQHVDDEGRSYEGVGKKFHASETVALLRDLAKQSGAQVAETKTKDTGQKVIINLGNMGITEQIPGGITIESD